MKVSLCLVYVTGSVSFLSQRGHHGVVPRHDGMGALRQATMTVFSSTTNRYVQNNQDISRRSMTETSTKSTAHQDRQEISPYYRRDRDDNSTAPLPPLPTLQLLLNGRWQARQDKNTTRVQQVDRELRINHGIYVYDHPPIWTRQLLPPLAWWRKRAEFRDRKRKELYGPTRHPLRRVRVSETNENTDVVLPEPLIHEQLSQWMHHHTRNTTQQERADAIQFELSLHGVHIDKTRLEWTTDIADDLASVVASATATLTPKNLCPTSSVQAIGTNFSDDDDVNKRHRIVHLIEQHAEASMTGRHPDCVFLRWELASCYGVQWNGNTNSWVMTQIRPSNMSLLSQELSSLVDYSTFSDDSIFPPLVFHENSTTWNSPMYRQSSNVSGMTMTRPPQPWIMDRVRNLVQERIHKREESKYLEADAIRHELWHTYNVGVNDRLQQYSLGGSFDCSHSHSPM